MKNKDENLIKSMDKILMNIFNLVGAAMSLNQSKQKAPYAFILLQTGFEETGRFMALLQKSQGLNTKIPKSHHYEKFLLFKNFSSIQPLGQRNYFEIVSDLIGKKIDKEKISKDSKYFKKTIGSFRELCLYVNINHENGDFQTTPWQKTDVESHKLVIELQELLFSYSGLCKQLLASHEKGLTIFAKSS